MRLLAIETSCDDASVAIVTDELNVMLDRKADAPSAAQDQASSSSMHGSLISDSPQGRSGSRMTHPVRVLAERTASQVELHNRYGGVFPELAAREHFATLLPTIEETLKILSEVEGLKQSPQDVLRGLDAIAVTAGPGLIGSLLVGVTVAQALAMGLGKKLIPVNHLAGHIYSVFLEDAETDGVMLEPKPPVAAIDIKHPGIQQHGSLISDSPEGRSGSRMTGHIPQFPLLALTVSGGHTQLVWMEDHGRFDVLGRTRDDAAGEAFDKVSVMLGLGYPGGPAIQRAAAEWKFQFQNDKRQTNSKIPIPKFPRPMIGEGLEFSFSGLKTAVRYWLDKQVLARSEKQAVSSRPNIRNEPSLLAPNFSLIGACAYEVQEAITDVLVTKLLRAAEKRRPKSLVLAGGVAANQRLREKLTERLASREHPRGERGHLHPWGVRSARSAPTLFISSRAHSTDNGAMIGAAALAMLATGFTPVDPTTIEARSTWPLESWQ